MLNFYLPQYHESGFAYTEGGSIDTANPVNGEYGQVFSFVEPVRTGFVQYRKLCVRNDGSFVASGVKIWLQCPDHTGQFTLGHEYVPDQFIGSPLSVPTGVAFSGFTGYTGGGIGLSLGSLYPAGYTGFWVKQDLGSETTSDFYVVSQVFVGWLE